MGKKAKRQHVDLLAVENWRDSSRTRVSCGIWMGVRIEETGDGSFRGIYGNPRWVRCRGPLRPPR